MTEFEFKVLETIKKIPKGRVTTYGEVAKAIRSPKSARAVGNALHKNPWAPKVPCHRIVNSNGTLGGYAGGVAKKINILRKEGVDVRRGRVINFKNILYKF
ncbi:cysteine methyltransferase [Candidatus Falkowbacteria bacterium RIFOXYB2_FULL_34_18]|uniref:methylated-DNA--[protein]-cysteine S-methyltransferase n=1 Tax=Candidatus Falkowbacteria bacterium RIFOXYD2_FULL_34_120 TaxID=1798007 RepID=A0A1F5TRC7_9BACT|nr:MAG: cysteine methyltransferase [Candidatus Falkowbacteria bacterium RIFOXYB2_FULL_34_18]OGF29954.1 MAG: cysteine methyltransferase [Candidatus Falkowbacteria bacterium RIFOXYC12_FULL_34_55]OGF37188.1 MAG: cysteine methyltransferase [Candidatus Falkowbacteria bacterium RIFOXYC2_FULL_34_220]OGF39492.1 MAG: cysteine methyltransferase [Candidatus Falkowbacteria bacterium RIFOXYD12_FULL_34_57]OGF41526.1 MAG: cysteine methyltransferase [Candidatus Falkowbacteria bacterium RIFOXYD2_FULL_34_120]